MQSYGHTCGIDDLMLIPKAEKERMKLIKRATTSGTKAQLDFVKEVGGDVNMDQSLEQQLRLHLSGVSNAENRYVTLAVCLMAGLSVSLCLWMFLMSLFSRNQREPR